MTDRLFITTAIDYTNGEPHLGHAYEKVLADVIARHARQKSEEVFFLTGVDQHGQKVQQSAEKAGVTPQQFVNDLTAKFHALWLKLGIEYSAWATTTDQHHVNCVRAILQRLWEDTDPATGVSRWLYKDKRSGYYSVRQEQFLTDKDMAPDGTFGPEWGEVEFREEENYYFRLEPHKAWLLNLIDERSRQGKPFVVPDFRVAELRNAVERLAGDLCISRPKARLAWGIEFPFDEDYVTYVWFDALVNYISFAPGYDPRPGADLTEFRRWWPALHVIGKDILIPAHGVYWPIMLHALGFSDADMPTLLVHGWWTADGVKMSKSLGNVVDPNDPADRFGSETLRYFLMAESTTGRDADYSEERLITVYNTDLANNLGNLLNRTLTMMQKYRSNRLRRDGATTGCENRFAPVGEDGLETYFAKVATHFANLSADAHYVDTALEIGRQCNLQIEQETPWKLAKDLAKADELDAFLYYLAESLRMIAIVLSPVMPITCGKMLDQLNWEADRSANFNRFRLANVRWGVLPDGHTVNAPMPLFPRYETKKIGQS